MNDKHARTGDQNNEDGSKPIQASIVNEEQDLLIKKLFSKVLTRQLTYADGCFVSCIAHVFNVWYTLLEDHGIDCSEHFELKDVILLNSLDDPVNKIKNILDSYYTLFEEAVEDDLVIHNFLMKVILPPHRTKAKKAINRLAEFSIWP